MSYTSANDTGKYAVLSQSGQFYTNGYKLFDPASRAYTVVPAIAELPRYAKQLQIFVPASTASATITVVFMSDADTQTVTLNYGPGNFELDGFIRRVTAVTGTGVVVTALTD